mgnify:CR=1 FL=1
MNVEIRFSILLFTILGIWGKFNYTIDQHIFDPIIQSNGTIFPKQSMLLFDDETNDDIFDDHITIQQKQVSA